MKAYDFQREWDLHSKKIPRKEIGQLCSLETITIQHILVDNDVVLNKEQERVHNLLHRGYSCLQISELLGIGLESVYDYIPSKKYKIKF